MNDRTGERIPVAILGATGTVGQKFLSLLWDHPWFEVRHLAASERSAGRPYGDAVTWVQGHEIPGDAARWTVKRCSDDFGDCPLVFSALDTEPARQFEPQVAEKGHWVVSNASAFRMDPEVPLIVPEVNAAHLDRLEGPRQRFSETGGIVTNPNCSTIGLVLALKPLHDAFGVRKVHVVTLQAVSGAGLPGVSSYLALDNVIPFIPSEEEKLETEVAKILGSLDGTEFSSAPVTISAQCNRVPVVDGHTLCVSLELEEKAEPARLIEAWNQWRAEPQALGLPSAPEQPTLYLGDDRPPQARIHRDYGAGMTTTIGRLRPCPLLDYRFVALSHNTLRGAAGGAILVAELLEARGRFDPARRQT